MAVCSVFGVFSIDPGALCFISSPIILISSYSPGVTASCFFVVDSDGNRASDALNTSVDPS